MKLPRLLRRSLDHGQVGKLLRGYAVIRLKSEFGVRHFMYHTGEIGHPTLAEQGFLQGTEWVKLGRIGPYRLQGPMGPKLYVPHWLNTPSPIFQGVARVSDYFLIFLIIGPGEDDDILQYITLFYPKQKIVEIGSRKKTCDDSAMKIFRIFLRIFFTLF